MSKAERTKQFIIEKTAPIFNEKGFVGTSMNDILDITGLSKGCVYGNFQNKDEIALAAFDHNCDLMTSFIKERLEKQNKIIDKLLVYPNTFRNFLSLPILKEGCPILNTSTEADDTHPLLKQRVIYRLNYWKSTIEKLINAGIEANEIKTSTNANEFSYLLISLIEGSVMQAKVTNNTEVLKVTMNYLEKMIKSLRV
ncbi:MAG: TetR/AcrR family transcriptional regulator [Limnohabitans sp.]|nr:TetR/AcrR family transcriptional regulator [Limnohabitans sp.]